MFDRCSRRPVARMLSGVIAGGATVGIFVLGGCSTVSGDGTAQPGQVAAYQSDISASKESVVRADGIALCRQAQSSIGMMVRSFNDFVTRLNATQNYDTLGGLNDKARASLIAGGDQIRPKVTAQTPADVADPTRQYLDTTGRLGDSIGARQKNELNALTVQWTQQRDRLLNACAAYVPDPPAPSTQPVAPSVPGGVPPAVPVPSSVRPR